jgi:hypothetical protein
VFHRVSGETPVGLWQKFLSRLASGFGIAGLVCLFPASLDYLRRRFLFGFFSHIPIGFSLFLVLLLIGIGLNWFLPFF